jgi:hypothetical protein
MYGPGFGRSFIANSTLGWQKLDVFDMIFFAIPKAAWGYGA